MFNSWKKLYQTNEAIESYYPLDNGLLILLLTDGFWGYEGDGITYITKSYDEGSSWEDPDTIPGDNYQLFIMENHWHMTGDSYTLVSSDEGNNWTIENMILPFNDVHFISREKGLITGGISFLHGAWGTLFLTEDGGENWNLKYIPKSNPTEIHFLTESKLFISCRRAQGNYDNYLSVSPDSGAHWVRDDRMGDVGPMYFLNDSTGWAIGQVGGIQFRVP